MEEILGLSLGHAESPAPAILVLRVLPDWLDALAEEMHGVAHVDAVPGVVVVDLVEGADGGDVFEEDGQSGFVVGRRRVLVVPDGPVELQWERTECLDEILEEVLSDFGLGLLGGVAGIERRLAGGLVGVGARVARGLRGVAACFGLDVFLHDDRKVVDEKHWERHVELEGVLDVEVGREE